MKKELTGLLGLLAALTAGAAPSGRIAAARQELLAEVRSVDAGGGALPGGYVLLGEGVFPLAECRNYDGTTAYAVVGGFYGAGRAVFLGHPNFLRSDDFRYDTRRFLQNAIRWTTGGKARPRVAVLRNDAVARQLKTLGCDAVATLSDLRSVGDYDLLALIGCRRDEVAAILAYVKGGGGLLQGSLGWGFLCFNKTACFAEDFVDNRLSAAIGALMGDTGVNRIGGQGFPAAGENVARGAGADEAITLAERGEIADERLRAQVAKTLVALANGLPRAVRPDLHARLAALVRRPGADRLPTPPQPLGAAELSARLALLLRKNAYLAEPGRLWPADPCAATYPGLVKPGTPSVTRSVPIDLSVPRWHSTGVFAPAGRALTVTLPEAATKLGLKLRVGTTADDLSGAAEWKRFPLVTMELPLTGRTTKFASPFGGLVYLVVPDRGLTGVQTVTLAGGVMAPWFRLGRDTAAKFAEECRRTGAPQGEIEGRDFIITAETAGLRRVEDPAWIAAFWDRVMAANLELAQWKTRRSPERICADVQLTAGWLHDGYPIMSHVNEQHFDWAIDRKLLEAGHGWGVYHELGHNHQNRAWTPEGTSEVTVNLFTLHALETVAGANVRDERYPCGAQRAQRRVREWVERGKRFEQWKQDYFLALEPYLRIREAYGWDAYRRTFARYLEPGFRQPGSDAEKWNVFARELSKSVNADMGAALAAWSIPLDEATRAACAAYPAAAPSIVDGLGENP
ncbi:MAG: M60 family metallopeptidase [Kiritimatiellia bacterium]